MPDGPPPALAGRRPALDPGRALADLVPPRRFLSATFASYLPDPAHPSQAAAAARLSDLADGPGRRGRRLPWSGGRRDARGVYLDGGFGVGKTHLLTALWHATDVPGDEKAYGTFVEYTHLVGALGFAATVAALGGRRLVCIDEFELDDPGDTVLMARLLREVMDAGALVAATSNTLPESLGEGRFAAEDFLREIQALSARFDVVRVDGPDYRHRGRPDAPPPATEADVAALARREGAVVDDFPALLAHLATLHPSRYGPLLDGVTAAGWHGVVPVATQDVALRVVVLVDRLYDRGVPVVATGAPLDAIFPAEMLAGGYRKKYLRALSRLAALAREGFS